MEYEGFAMTSLEMANFILRYGSKKYSNLELQKTIFFVSYNYEMDYEKRILKENYVTYDKLGYIYEPVYKEFRHYGANNIDVPLLNDVVQLDAIAGKILYNYIKKWEGVEYWDKVKLISLIIDYKYDIYDVIKNYKNYIDTFESIVSDLNCKSTSNSSNKTDCDNKSKDNINPNHYKNGKVECIDALESATVNKKGLEAVCVSNVIKYLWRYEDKNGLEDVKKAQWYLNKLIEHLSVK